jgi:hypothetical protein
VGKASKQKGYRAEIALRNYLRQRGWESDRVPMSGAVASLPGDVRAKKDDKSLLFEMKMRKSSFSSIYALYDAHLAARKDDVLAVVVPGGKKLCLLMSTSLDAVFDGPDYFELAERHPCFVEHGRAFKRFETVQKWLKSSDILVLKDNNRPFLFLRFR